MEGSCSSRWVWVHIWQQHALFQKISQPLILCFRMQEKQVHPQPRWSSLLETANEVRAHEETCCSPYNVGVMTEKNTGPLVLSSPVSHIYVLPWQLVRNKALKQQEAQGISLSQTAQQGMQSPPCRAADSVRWGWEATWSSIMNPQGLVLPLATGAKTVHPGS